MKLKKTIVLVAALLACTAALAATSRSAAEVSAFKRQNPCPSTGERRGACPGYVVDHVVALCAGGPDKISNMQWQKYEESLVKDQEERRTCRALKSPSSAAKSPVTSAAASSTCHIGPRGGRYTITASGHKNYRGC